MERTREDVKMVAEFIPEMLKIVDRFDAWGSGHLVYEDLLNQADWLITAAAVYCPDMVDVIDPLLLSGVTHFEDSSSIGLVAMGRYLVLAMLDEHSEVMIEAIKRAKDEVYAALTYGTIPERLAHGKEYPPNPTE